MRLWELEGGDGDDVGLGFIGGRANGANQPAPDVHEIEIVPEAIEVEESDTEQEDVNGGNDGGLLDDQGQPVHVAREAPLVLRLMDNQPRGGRNDQRPVPPAAPDAPAAAGRRQNIPPRAGAGRGRGGARAGRAGGRGRGGRGGANRPNQQNQQQNQNANERQQQQQQPAQGQNGQNEEVLDEAQAAWVRHFVQLALIDAEGDSDEDDWP